MSFRKFSENDVFTNTMRASPKVDFYIYNGKVYYNDTPIQNGARNTAGSVVVPSGSQGLSISVPNTNQVKSVKNINAGFVSLYEYNIDRPILATDRIAGKPHGGTGSYDDAVDGLRSDEPITFVEDKSIIYPYISKDSSTTAWKTVNAYDLSTAFKYGDVLTSNYPLSASITREYITLPSSSYPSSTSNYNKHYVALRNRLNFYATRSPHYKVDSFIGNKNEMTLNLISIPSIFYGTKIKPGTISLKFYITGTLFGELQDTRENGELIQVGPPGSPRSGSVAGVALYDEGFLLLSGAWDLDPASYGFTNDSQIDEPKWIYFGAGARDKVTPAEAHSSFNKVSFNLSFKGHTETQVLTMFTHAGRGEANYSNNPTFVKKSQIRNEFTSSHVYEQRADVQIKNIVSSSYYDYAAPFKRQLYISKIGIYDKHKNLIALGTLSNPVLKKEEDNISFKLKLDI